MKCPYCGFELQEDTRFCTECGKDLHSVPETEQPASLNEESVAAEDLPADSAPVIAAPEAAPAPVPMMESAATGSTTVYHGVLDKKPDRKSRWATIGTWGWFGILLLLSIPLVNMICLLVWSFGGARKQVKQSFARASLILVLLTAILSIVATILLHQFAPVILDQLAVWFAY